MNGFMNGQFSHSVSDTAARCNYKQIDEFESTGEYILQIHVFQMNICRIAQPAS